MRKEADMSREHPNKRMDTYHQIFANDNSLRRALRTPGIRITLLCMAAEFGDAKGFQRLIGTGLDINFRDAGGYSCLHYTVIDGTAEATRFLLAGGADIDATSRNEETPLHLAVRHRNLSVIRVLIEHGAYLNWVERISFFTPLMHAVITNQIETVKLLVEAGADISYHSRMRSAPILAAFKGYSGMLEAFLDAGADPSRILSCIGGKGEIPILQLLLRRGADVNHVLDDYGTPLIQACLTGFLRQCEIPA